MIANYIEVLDLAKAGHWDEAHQRVQPYSDRMACLIHGYLHRVEGDLNNARYWYSRANESMPDNTLEDEWSRLRILANSDDCI